jgi:enoyl-CoA hydratase
MESLLVDVRDRIATLTLNRPEVRNALNSELWHSIPRQITELDQDENIDVIILTGADPAFSAGVDLKELGTRPVQSDDATMPVIPNHTTPLIGAVNGPCVTGGLELALGCDFLMASDRARFADTHSRVGVMPGWGLTVLLPQAIGIRRAREMSASGRYIDATTALDWGLVNHVVPHDQLLSFCREMATDIVSSDRTAVQRLFLTYAQGSDLLLPDAWRLEGEVAREWFRSSYGGPEEVERRRAEIVTRGRSQIT